MNDGTTIFVVADGWHMTTLGFSFGLGVFLAISVVCIVADITSKAWRLVALRWVVRRAARGARP